MRWAILARILFSAGAVAIVLAVMLSPFSGVSEVANEAVRYQLNLTGSSIYEYHALRGQWPTQNADLARTSLPIRFPYWRYLLDEELIVIVWHKTLKPKPQDNADHILAYYNKGLISERGRSWVCWGDLRTEYIKTEELRAYLIRVRED